MRKLIARCEYQRKVMRKLVEKRMKNRRNATNVFKDHISHFKHVFSVIRIENERLVVETIERQNKAYMSELSIHITTTKISMNN